MRMDCFVSISSGLIWILPKYAVSLIESFEFDRYNKGEVVSSPFQHYKPNAAAILFVASFICSKSVRT